MEKSTTHYSRLLTCLTRSIERTIKFLIHWCIVIIRPILGPASCKFKESCTPFALRQLKEQRFCQACVAIAKRLLMCSPFN